VRPLKYHIDDIPREKIVSIEKSAKDYYPCMPKIPIERSNEKSSSEAPKKKRKKIHSESHQTTVA